MQKDREERYQVIKDLALDLKSLRKGLEFSAEFERVTDGAERNLTAELPKRKTLAPTETGKQFSALYFLPIVLAAVLIFGGVWWFLGRNNNKSEATEAAALKAVEVVSWNSSPGEFYSVGSFSPDNKTVAFTSTKTGTRNIWIKRATSGEAVQIIKNEFNNEKPIWSPNGDELAFLSTRGNETGIWRIPILGGLPKEIILCWTFRRTVRKFYTVRRKKSPMFGALI